LLGVHSVSIIQYEAEIGQTERRPLGRVGGTSSYTNHH
jgi:hypothetical protein